MQGAVIDDVLKFYETGTEYATSITACQGTLPSGTPYVKGIQARLDSMPLNPIGDMNDLSGSDCTTWVLADSGNLSLNFKVHYTDERINSIRYSSGGDLASTVGATDDFPDESTGYLMNLDQPYTTFYGFYGYQDPDDGTLKGFGSISINRKDFDDNLIFLDETNVNMADAKGRLAEL